MTTEGPRTAATAVSLHPRALAPRLAAVLERRVGPERDRSVWLSAAVLLVDLSGFTRTTEQLGLNDAALGAERVSGLLNDYFGRTVSAVDSHGGDVLFFAGDAVVAVWPGETDLAAAVCRAAACATEIGQQPAAVGGVHLRRYAAIGAGRLGIFEVGAKVGEGPVVFAGPAMMQLGAPLAAARPGEVLLSSAAAAIAAGGCGGSRLSDGVLRVDWVRPPSAPAELPPVLPAEDARRRVPSHWLGVAETVWVGAFGELRRIAVAFLDLSDLLKDDLTDGARLRRAVMTVERHVSRAGGVLHEVVQDDKGLTAVAAFGLPPRAHEHDALGAVRAALSAQAELSQLGIVASVGIASGQVFAGFCGSETRTQFCVVGSPMNLASRLMKVANGRVLCDEETRRAASASERAPGPGVGFDSLPKMALKGRGTVATYSPKLEHRVVGARADLFVGRRREIDTLDLALRGSPRAAPPHPILVIGEAGVGKTHLLDNLAVAARARGAQVFTGQGDPIERSMHYHAFRGVLRALLGDERGSNDGATLGRALLTALEGAPRLAAWAPLLEGVLPLGLEETELTSRMEAAGRADSIKDLFAHLLLSRTRGAQSVLVVDDAHWLDSNSAELGLSLMQRVPGLVVVFGSRPDEIPEALSRNREQPGERTVIDLGPLDPSDIGSLVAARLGARSASDEVLGFIWGRAEGHPLHSEEMALALKDSGLVSVEDGVVRLAQNGASLDGLVMPGGLRGVISTRIDHLPAKAQAALKVASVIGKGFDGRALMAICPSLEGEEDLVEQLQTLERAAMVRSSPTATTWEFRHATIRDVAYETLLYSQRGSLHQKLAEWIEATCPPGEAPHAVLAHHWELAGQNDLAVTHLERAGERALTAHSNREATLLLGRAMDLARRSAITLLPHRRASWSRSLGFAHFKLSEYEAARKHLTESIALEGFELPRGRATTVVDLLRSVTVQIAHRAFPSSAPVAERDRKRHSHLAEMSMRLAEVAFFANDPVELVSAVLRGLNAAERAQETSALINSYGALGVVLSLAGARDWGESYVNRALETARLQGSRYDRAYADEVAATFFISVGKWERAGTLCEKAAEIFEELGDRFRRETGLCILGYSHLVRGHVERAVTEFDRAYGSTLPDGALQSRVWARAGRLAGRLYSAGADREAEEDLDALMSAAIPNSETILGAGMLAHARLFRGDLPGAREAARRAIGAAERTAPTVYYQLWGLVGIADVAFADFSTSAAAREMARDTEALLKRLAMMNPVAVPASLRVKGILRRLQGNHAGSVRMLRQSAARSEELGMRIEAGLAHAELSRTPGSERNHAHRTAARTHFEGAGAHALITRYFEPG